MSVERDAPGSVALPRREGFLVRWRARMSLLPGQVSTAALVQLKRQRIGALLAVPFFLFFVIGIPLAAIASSHTRDRSARVALIVAYDTGTFGIVLDNGDTLVYNQPPGVFEGQAVVERLRSSTPIGLVIDGRYASSRADSSAGAWFLAVFFLPFALFGVPSWVWTWRSYRDVKRDLAAPLERGAGTYVGSWVWRGATTRFWARGRGLKHIAGITIAVAEEPGSVTWYTAPLELLVEVRHFEEAIAASSHNVTYSYHPHTHALATLNGANGATLDLQHSIDAMHPETGLQLKVGRRSHVGHLPDL
ncbi:MAG: hypothetical protein QOE63_1334 [Acidimicrobiaceae bacterium]